MLTDSTTGNSWRCDGAIKMNKSSARKRKKVREDAREKGSNYGVGCVMHCQAFHLGAVLAVSGVLNKQVKGDEGSLPTDYSLAQISI